MFTSIKRYLLKRLLAIWRRLSKHCGKRVDGEREATAVTTFDPIRISLQGSEIPFRDLADRIDCIFWTMNPETLSYLYVSRGFDRFWGLSANETPSLSNTWMDQIHPDDRETALWNFTEKSRFAEIDQEFRIVLPDGRLKWGRERSFPIRNPAGETVRVVGMTEDITLRKEGEHEKERLLVVEKTARRLSELAEARFRILTESIPGIVCTFGPDGRLNYQNLRWLEYTGLSLEQSIDWGWASAVHSDDRDEMVLKWRNAVEAGEPFEAEFRLCSKENLHRWFLARGVPLPDDPRGIEMWIWTCTDIHENRQNQEIRAQLLDIERLARDEAEAANHAKDEFVALVSHELRSPLNAMLGWARILRSDKADPVTVAKAVKTIEESANTQLRLIEDLLDTARIITGKLQLELSVVNLALVTKGAVEILRPSLEAKDLQFSLTVDKDISGFQGDPDRLHQVVGNLVLNAIKFTPSKGIIRVTLQKTDSFIRLTVSDNGQGVPPELLSQIFNRFNQGTTTGSGRSSGLGLGLPLARHIVELHGGTIRAESKGVSRGTTFFVDLPLPQTRNRELLLPPVPEQTPKPFSRENDPLWNPPLRFAPTLTGLHFLVVDDEDFSRDLVATVLRNYGARVAMAASVAEAMGCLTTLPLTKFDGIVSDIGMPDEDGYGFIRRVRALTIDQGGRTPAVALTAYTSTPDRIRVLEAGFQIHLGKPVEPVELMKAVAHLSGRQITPIE